MSTLGPAGEAALVRIVSAGGTRIDPPTLMPARIILELSGEAVRARLCTFTDAAGEEIALRPDFTTPIASMIAKGSLKAGRYHYSGEVYRLATLGTGDAIEFAQVGFEWFGGAGADEDAEAVALTLEAAAAGGADGMVRFGDVSLYRAVVDALAFSLRWKDRLKRAFARRRGPKDLLQAHASAGDYSTLAASLAALPEEEAKRAVEEIFAIAGVQPVGGRGAAEIAERLRDAAGDRAPDAGAAKALVSYLSIEASASACVGKLEAFAKSARIDISGALQAFVARLEKAKALKPPFWSSATFSAEAGRRFEYYDGFVFDLSRPGAADRPIAAGGRYDGLVARLNGQGKSASAIGAALRVDRLGASK